MTRVSPLVEAYDRCSRVTLHGKTLDKHEAVHSSRLALTCTARLGGRNEYLTSNQQRIDLNLSFFCCIHFGRSSKNAVHSVAEIFRVFASLYARVCNYKDFEWFLYYISNPAPLRRWQIQFSLPQRTVCIYANFLCEMSCQYSSRHSTVVYALLSREYPPQSTPSSSSSSCHISS